MSKQTTYKRLSARSRDLLGSGEGKHVDYKESVKGLHAEDFVAFANSEQGGAILIGVEEATGSDGMQKGRPVGCSVDDSTRLQIMSKALSCSPAVQIELFVENTEGKPFFRIEIPSGAHKPYATSNGTYKVREDGRNNPLLPEALLEVFLEREGKEFRSRFSEATSALEQRMEQASETVEKLEGVISSKIEEISDTLGWAEHKASDAADTIETVSARVAALSNEQRKQSQRIKSIITKTEATDPVKEKAEQDTLEYLKQKLKEDPSLLAAAKDGKSLSISLSRDVAAELSEDDLRRLFTEAVRSLLETTKDA